MTENRQIRFHLWGWILFVFSALCYVVSSIRAGDPLGLAGGILFLLACLLFLAPLLADSRRPINNSSPPCKCSRYRRGWFRAAHCLSRAPAAPTTPPAPARLSEQSRRLAARQALRFYASTR